MIVVALIGLLAVIAIPSFIRSRRESLITVHAQSLRLAADAFSLRAVERGTYPDDVSRSVVPAGMAEYMPKRMVWTERTPLGGAWDWDRDVFGFSAGVSTVGNDLAPADFLMLDKKIDDGDLNGGAFRMTAEKRFTWVIEE